MVPANHRLARLLEAVAARPSVSEWCERVPLRRSPALERVESEMNGGFAQAGRASGIGHVRVSIGAASVEGLDAFVSACFVDHFAALFALTVTTDLGLCDGFGGPDLERGLAPEQASEEAEALRAALAGVVAPSEPPSWSCEAPPGDGLTRARLVVEIPASSLLATLRVTHRVAHVPLLVREGGWFGRERRELVEHAVPGWILELRDLSRSPERPLTGDF